MKLQAVSLGILISLGFAGAAHAEPRNLKAFCAAHKTYAGPGESGTKNRAVLAMNADTWRCMGGRVWVCYLGASGAGCLRTSRYDVSRRRAFEDYCRQNPNIDYVPMSLQAGLASEWRCRGLSPVKIRSIPVDRLGYMTASWKPLP